MAKYKVLVKSVIGSGIVEAGAIIDYDGESEGVPSENLALIPDSDSKGKSAPKASVEE